MAEITFTKDQAKAARIVAADERLTRAVLAVASAAAEVVRTARDDNRGGEHVHAEDFRALREAVREWSAATEQFGIAAGMINPAAGPAPEGTKDCNAIGIPHTSAGPRSCPKCVEMWRQLAAPRRAGR